MPEIEGESKDQAKGRATIGGVLVAFFAIALAIVLVVHTGRVLLPAPLDAVVLAVGDAFVAVSVLAAVLTVFARRITWIHRVIALVVVLVVLAAGIVVAVVGRPPVDAPTRLTIEPSPDNVSLSWHESTDDSRVIEYRLYRNGVRIYTGRDTRYVDRDVKPGESYDYYVVAAGGEGEQSAQVEFPSVQVPRVSASYAAPRQVMATAANNGVVLSWAPGDGKPPPAYVVRRDGVKVGESDQTYFIDATVVSEKTYTYTVRAFDPGSHEESVDSEPATVHTPPASRTVDTPRPGNNAPTPPSRPGRLTQTGRTQTSISMSWLPSAPGSRPLGGYRIARDGLPYDSVGSGIVTYRDAAVRAGQSYRYSVQAVDLYGLTSLASPTVRMTAVAPPTPRTPADTASFTNVTNGSPVGDCVRLTGQADLAPDRTILFATYRTTQPTGTFYFSLMSVYKNGNVPATWSGVQSFGSATGQRYDLYLLIMDVEDAEVFWNSHVAGGGGYAYATAIPAQAKVASRISVTQTSHDAC